MQRIRDEATPFFAECPELLVLVVATIAASATFGIFIGSVSLTDFNMQTAVAYGLIALVSVVWSVAGGFLQIPPTVRLLDLIGLIFVGCMLTPSALHTYVLLTPWFASVYLGHLVPPLLPTKYMRHTDEQIEDHLSRFRFARSIYDRQAVNQVRTGSWTRTTTLFSTCLIATLIAAIMRGAEWFQSEADKLALIAAGLSLSLLMFQSLVQLVTRQRTWENDPAIKMDPQLTRPWLKLVAGATIFITLLGVMLPANISPLYAVDWNTIMDNFAKRLTLRQQPPIDRDSLSMTFGDMPSTRTAPGSGTPHTGGGTALLGLLFLITAAGALIWVISHVVRIFLGRERDQVPMLPRVLLLFFTWPIMFVRYLLNFIGIKLKGTSFTVRRKRGTMKREQVESVVNVGKVDPGNLTIRRLFRLLLQKAHEAGLPRQESETAQEFAVNLSKTLPDAARDIEHVTDAYERVRYSHGRAPSGWVERARAAWQRVMEAFK